MEMRIPKHVNAVIRKLNAAGHEAYVVGGAVRDSLLGAASESAWDLATSATPEQVQSVFRRSLYTNRFGTVIVQEFEHEVEVTTYRVETGYADGRRPDGVTFTGSLEADLSRRDFTINSMAVRPVAGSKEADGVTQVELVDPFGGKADLDARLLRAVGDPDERFKEDALRMLRAARFTALLHLRLEPETAAAINRNSGLAAGLSGQRIQQEFLKILLAPQPSVGLRLFSDLGLLKVICPELERCRTIPQDKAVAQDVLEHSLITVDATPDGDLVLRLAGLFHDIGKPDTFADGHFHQHEYVGEAITRAILRRWRFSKDTIAQVTHLVRHHMFWYQNEWTGSAVRRFIRKVGLENIPALFALRKADSIGSGARSPRMYALEQLWLRVSEEIDRATAFSTRDLAVNGHDLMNELALAPGPDVGRLMSELLELVLDDPELNTRESLLAQGRRIRDAGAEESVG